MECDRWFYCKKVGKSCGPLSLIERIHSGLAIQASAGIRIFLSYSWKRGEYADLVEAILLRLGNVGLFRDENEIRSGKSITSQIELELKQCNASLALWGREYVESPHCYDEMNRWHALKGLSKLYLLRFDNTRPVWPFLRKSIEDTNDFARKWPIVNVTEKRPVLQKELIEFINGLRLPDPSLTRRTGNNE